MSGAQDAFGAAARAHFDEALARGFPAFLTSIAESMPVNAAPYLGGYEDFRRLAAQWPGRGALLDALEKVRTASGRCGVAIEAILLGGSFADLANPAPGDVDCLMFYRQAGPAEPVDARALAELRKRAKQECVDVRFLPIDADPIALIKSLCYFTILFCQAKAGSADARGGRGLVLLDCRD